MREDLCKNVPQHMRRALSAYLQWLRRNERPAERLCQAGVPTWIVHAEKGDGGLTAEERRTLESCPHAHVVTIPGQVFFLPNEVPEQIAGIVLQATGQAQRQSASRP
jgi:pimeloyl-ACP methyl ester carboxylesterase